MNSCWKSVYVILNYGRLAKKMGGTTDFFGEYPPATPLHPSLHILLLFPEFFWPIVSLFFCRVGILFFFVNDHAVAGRKERGNGSGEGSQGQPRSGRPGQKAQNFTFQVWTRRGREMGVTFLSLVAWVGWALHCWHWHPWTRHLSSGGQKKK